jgi:ribosomal protein L20A (L18A)
MTKSKTFKITGKTLYTKVHKEIEATNEQEAKEQFYNYFINIHRIDVSITKITTYETNI